MCGNSEDGLNGARECELRRVNFRSCLKWTLNPHSTRRRVWVMLREILRLCLRRKSGVEPPHSKCAALLCGRDFEVSGAGDGLMGDLVGHFYFEGVVAGSEGSERETTVQSDLFAVAAYGAGRFGGGPDFFFVAKEAIRCGGTGLAKEFVEF